MRFHLAIVLLAFVTATPAPSPDTALEAREADAWAPDRRCILARAVAELRDNPELSERDPDEHFSRDPELVYSEGLEGRASFVPRCPAAKGKPARRTAPQKKDRPPANNPDGCGPPGILNPLVPELIFTPCCNDHDICYTTCKRSKWDCDKTFRSCLHGRCDSKFRPGGILHGVCIKISNIYYKAVRSKRSISGFKGASAWYCNCR